MAISKENVEHVGRLAHVGLQPGEIEELSHELSSVLDHIARLDQIDTSDVDPTAYAVAMHNVWRDDVIEPSWEPAAVLANAPRRSGDYFEVQAVLE